jgi:hypothetical protein
MRSAILVVAALVITCATTFAQSQIGGEARLKEKNIILPAPPKPVGNYVEWVRVGNLLYLAGHGPTTIGRSTDHRISSRAKAIF